VQVGEVTLEVLHCPGHTPGHVVLYDRAGGQLVVGDVLFRGSIGRTDFPRGSFPQLEASIRGKLYVLPPETVVHCGHGPPTTVGHEAATNPFVQA
jgi:hydroxyacylglutathione hydrolase